VSHDDFATEPDPAAPGQLPKDEKILWQGGPDWRDLAWRAYHLREASAYFGLLMAWRGFSAWWETGLLAQAALAVTPLLLPAFLCAAILTLIAWLSARTTLYTITDKRLVLRIGIALPTTFNLPFLAIGSADLRETTRGCGDIGLALSSGDKLAYLMLWPHARPWRIKQPEPMLRSVPECGKVAHLLAAGLQRAAGQPAATTRIAAMVHEENHAGISGLTMASH
jgi:Bacterial PH domain